MTAQILIGLLQVATTILVGTFLAVKLERYKSDLGIRLGKTNRFDEKEFAELEAAWITLQRSFTAVGKRVKRVNGYGDPLQLEREAERALRETEELLIQKDIYLPAALGERMQEVRLRLEHSNFLFGLDEVMKDPSVRDEGKESYQGIASSFMSALKADVRAYLRQHQEPRRRKLRLPWWRGERKADGTELDYAP